MGSREKGEERSSLSVFAFCLQHQWYISGHSVNVVGVTYLSLSLWALNLASWIPELVLPEPAGVARDFINDLLWFYGDIKEKLMSYINFLKACSTCSQIILITIATACIAISS